MKAYMVWGTDDDRGCSIVFADERNQAKLKAQRTDACEDERYIDIKAKRLPLLDGMEECEPTDNPWLNDNIRLILVRDYGWHCMEPNEYENCDECNAKQYCGYWEE